MCDTFDEVTELFPLWHVLEEETISQRFYCASDVTLDMLKNYFGEANVKQVSPHHAVAKHKSYKTVDGYLYDGRFWWPAVRVGQQWEKYERTNG